MYKRKTGFLLLILLGAGVLALLPSCTTPAATADEAPQQIENTLKSVTLVRNPAQLDMTEIKALFEGVNQAIDSIGFPDAGYQLWAPATSDSLGFEFIVEGHWPDQARYDLIHEHELYKAATDVVQGEWEKMEQVTYYRLKEVR